MDSEPINRPKDRMPMKLLDKPDNPSFDFARERWNDFMFQPTYRLEIKMRHENLAWALERLLSLPIQEVEHFANRENNYPTLLWAAASCIVSAGKKGKWSEIDKMVDRVLGCLPPVNHLTEEGVIKRACTFSEFCQRAGYGVPFPKQIEMMEFGIRQPGARLILGSRGYGKTDYVVILGWAWRVFNDPTATALIITKSETRNKGIVKEFIHALEANGVKVRDKSGLDVNVPGQKGKDPTLSAVTLGTSSLRGRHPDLVIMDDPVTPEDAGSLAARKKATTVYSEAIKLSPNILIIGQPAHKADLYADLRPKLLKMEVPHGTIPELDHDLVAMKIAGVSLDSIKMSYHLEVPEDGTNPLTRIQSIDEFPFGSCVAFIDPSFKGGDYTAISVIRQMFDGVAVYGRVWKKAWSDCVDDIAEVCEGKGVQRVAFETNSLGEMPVSILRIAFAEKQIACGVIGWTTTSNKHARIMALAPFAKNIYVSKDSDVEYVNQTKNYEYGIPNDDAPDSLSSGLEWIGYVKGLSKGSK